MRNIIISAFVLTVLAACGEKKNASTAAPKPGSSELEVEAMVVKTSSISDKLEVSGNILPFESTEIKPEISGRVISLNITEGAMVPRGHLLVKLFDGDLRAELQKLMVQQQIASKTEERQKELLKINGISQQDYDLSLLQLNNIDADIQLTKVAIGKRRSGRLMQANWD